MRSGVPVLVGVVAVGVCVLSELAAAASQLGWRDPVRWAPDLLTGVALAVAGAAAWRARPASRTGPLIVASSLLWSAGNLAPSVLVATSVGWLLAALHRGPLAAVVLTYPGGRRTDGEGRLGTLLAWVSVAASAMAPVASEACWAAVVGIGSVARYRAGVGLERRARLAAARAGTTIAAILGVALAAQAAGARPEVGTVAVIAYQAAIVLGIGGLAVALVRGRWERADVADLVVTLGEGATGDPRDELAAALGDPSLEIAYWSPAAGGYVDRAGRRAAVAGGDERVATPVTRDGEPIAVIVHDREVLNDPGLVEAVTRAAALGAVNARLNAELVASVEELRASESRLVAVDADERRRLVDRLRSGPLQRLVDVGPALDAAAQAAPADAGGEISGAQALLRDVQRDLESLAAGLRPPELAAGLDAAIRAIAERTPIPMSVAGTVGPLSEEVETVAYFVVLEGTANAVKHARATRLRLAQRRDGQWLEVSIEDDGTGGADPARGSGLRGLAERVTQAGGRLAIQVPLGGGTRLVANLPIDRDLAGVVDETGA